MGKFVIWDDHIHTLCDVLWCKMVCKDGRREAAGTVEDGGLGMPLGA